MPTTDKYGDLLADLFKKQKAGTLSEFDISNMQRIMNEFSDREEKYKSQITLNNVTPFMHLAGLRADRLEGLSYLYLTDTDIPTGATGQKATYSSTTIQGDFTASGNDITFPKAGRAALMFGKIIIAAGAVSCSMYIEASSPLGYAIAEYVLTVPCLSGATIIPFVFLLDNTQTDYEEFQIYLIHGAAGSKNAEIYLGLMHVL